MILELEWTQELVETEIMKYKDLLDEEIITEKEFFIKEKELLSNLKRKKSNSWFKKS